MKTEIPNWLDAQIWSEFKKMRHRIKRPLTEYAEGLALKKLGELRKAGEDPVEVLNQSIFYGWQGLFAVKDKVPQRHTIKIRKEDMRQPEDKPMTREQWLELRQIINGIGKKVE